MLVVVAHESKPISEVTVEFSESCSQLGVLPHYATQPTSAVEKPQWVLRVQNVQIPSLVGRVLGQKEEILEQLGLPYCFRAAPPSDELEFGDLDVGFQVEQPARIASTERQSLDRLPVAQNAGQRQQDSDRMN